MNIGKYGLWKYRRKDPATLEKVEPPEYIYTPCKILAVVDGKYSINPLRSPGNALYIDPKDIYILERKNS